MPPRDDPTPPLPTVHIYIYSTHSHIPLLQPRSASYQKWQDTGEHETSFMRRIKQVSAPKPASGWIISHKNPRAWIPWGGGVTWTAAADGEAGACERVWGEGNYAGNDGKYKPGEFHRGCSRFSCVERVQIWGECLLFSCLSSSYRFQPRVKCSMPRRIFRWRPSDGGINLRLGGNRRLKSGWGDVILELFFVLLLSFYPYGLTCWGSLGDGAKGEFLRRGMIEAWKWGDEKGLLWVW